uniref:Uncharacterized protein LOC100368888 n=1 Tax=Saccoglossus kowalevskii TaxID=10224 RepID=A0ABM0MBR5_SACKO|nr:PREDICTED: uncharacterized protein LOC100368888 [Saccoglossus kowalevskii]
MRSVLLSRPNIRVLSGIMASCSPQDLDILLGVNRLKKYSEALRSLGVDVVEDINDVTEANLKTIGMTTVEINRFVRMRDSFGSATRLSMSSSYSMSATTTDMSSSASSIASDDLQHCEYVLHYKTFTNIIRQETRQINGLNPYAFTMSELVNLILQKEGQSCDVDAQLYDENGTPLTYDVFFNTWTLDQRKIESGALLFAIFHSRRSEDDGIPTLDKLDHTEGADVLNVHIMMGRTYKVHVDLMQDTDEIQHIGDFEINDIVAHVQHLSGSSALACSLANLLHQKSTCFPQKVALIEGLYFLFRRILPSPNVSLSNCVTDECVFEYSCACWAYILNGAKGVGKNSDKTSYSLICSQTYERLMEPVTITMDNGRQFICEKSFAIQKIEDGEIIAGYSLPSAAADNLEPACEIERYLQCWPYSFTECYVWPMPPGYKHKCSNIEAMSVEYLEKTISEFEFLKIYSPLQLKENVPVPCLTLDHKALVVIYQRRAKSLGPIKVVVHNPLKMADEYHELDDLALSLKDHPFSEYSCTTAKHTHAKFTREPQEAIVVLLDISASMAELCLKQSMKKIEAVKHLFHAFADRSIAYDFWHVIGLTTFCTDIVVVDECTEALNSFKEKVDQVFPRDSTAMYDAVINAVSQLNEIGETYPNCKRRILCLTDGYDNVSKKSIVEAATSLQRSNVCLDSVLVGGANDNLKSLTKSTGGCCFHPTSLKEALKLFEMETVLSVRARKTVTKAKTITKQMDLYKYMAIDYDKPPGYNVPDDIRRPVSPAHVILNKVATDPPKGLSTASARVKRILREISAYNREPYAHIHIYPCDNNIGFWRVLLVGPQNTPYEGGVFVLYVDFPDKYPLSPPQIRFLTPIYHCNINVAGRICHSIFDRNYTPDTPVSTILMYVFGLLITPEPDDPLDSVLAEEYFSDKDKYYETAKQYTKNHAYRTLRQCQQEILGSAEREAEPLPSHLICPLTKELFVDPVVTPYGHVYERHAIEDHLSKSNYDPMAKKPLQRGQLKPKNGIFKLVTEYRTVRVKADTWWQQ